MKRSEIIQIETLIKEADYKGTSAGYSSVFEKLKKMNANYPSDFLLEYYKGLVCYSNPDMEDFRVKQAISHFEKSHVLNPDYFMAQVYLGHCYFDFGNYRKALDLFREVLSKEINWESLIKNNQIWRLANLAEMIVVCCLKLNQVSKIKDYYRSWKELYYINIQKKNDFYFPESLVIEASAFLKSNGSSLSDENIPFFRGVSLDLIGIIKGGDGFEIIYSEELKILKNWNGNQQLLPIKTYSF